MTDMKYTVGSMDELADYFAMLASDQRAMIGRFSKTARDKQQRTTEARIWDEAARIVRNTVVGEV